MALQFFLADQIDTCTLRCTYSEFLNSKLLSMSLVSLILFICTGFYTFSKCQESVKASPPIMVSEY
jgi:hypothetical protein